MLLPYGAKLIKFGVRKLTDLKSRPLDKLSFLNDESESNFEQPASLHVGARAVSKGGNNNPVWMRDMAPLSLTPNDRSCPPIVCTVADRQSCPTQWLECSMN